jgi:hypothetical protein
MALAALMRTSRATRQALRTVLSSQYAPGRRVELPSIYPRASIRTLTIRHVTPPQKTQKRFSWPLEGEDFYE